MKEDLFKIYDDQKDDTKRYSLTRVMLSITFSVLIILLIVPIVITSLITNVELYNNIIDTLVFVLLILCSYAFGSKVNHSFNKSKINK